MSASFARRTAHIAAIILTAFPGGGSVVAAPCWPPPVSAVVSDPFRQPDCPWCPGNRGIEYATSAGDIITSVAAGSVSFSGSIVGVRYVVVTIASGWRITYGNLSESRLVAGDVVVAGMTVGRAAGAFHFGVRDGDDDYLDPTPYLGVWRVRVRLVPTDGTAATPSPPATLRCETAAPAALGPSTRRARNVATPIALLPGSPLGVPSLITAGRSSAVTPIIVGVPEPPDNRYKEQDMAVISMRQMLEAGVHFGHQTRRWNPKMKRFIFGERNGIYIIDLEQTLTRVETAYVFVRDLVANGGDILFVGTKKQAQDPVQSYAEKVGMPYVNERWLGGMLTNFETISKSINKMLEYERMKASGEFDAMIKKEALLLDRDLIKLQRNLGGLRHMKKAPKAIFVIDTKKEHIAVTEANKLGIPVVAIVDTNVDPDVIQFPIPGNDDAIRANMLLARVIAEAVEEGRYIASRRPRAAAAEGAVEPKPERSAEEEAAFAQAQAEARNAAAKAQQDREARLTASKTKVEPAAVAADGAVDEVAADEVAAAPATEEAPVAATPEVEAVSDDAVADDVPVADEAVAADEAPAVDES